MKKILVMSDSHFHNKIVLEIIEKHPEVDDIVHCGDVQDDLKPLDNHHVKYVRGNNDLPALPMDISFTCEGKQIHIIHGHIQDIDIDLNGLITLAKDNNDDIVLYGHTHHPCHEIIEGKLYLNPGSVFFPRGGKILTPTYSILTINDDGTYEIHYYSAKTHDCFDDEVYKHLISTEVKQPIVKTSGKEEKPPKKGGFFAKLFSKN